MTEIAREKKLFSVSKTGLQIGDALLETTGMVFSWRKRLSILLQQDMGTRLPQDPQKSIVLHNTNEYLKRL